MSEKVDRVARALWDARERRFPERVRRPPDDIDRATDAWAYCVQDARAAIEAYLSPRSTRSDTAQ